MFFNGAHLAECDVEAVGTEQRIVAESFITARWPHHDAIDATFEILDMSIGPGETESGGEMCTPLFRSLGTALDQQCLDTIHRCAKILVWSGPTRGMDPRLAAKCIDDQSGVVGKCRFTARTRGSNRLDARVLRKGRSRLFWFGETKLAGGLGGNSVGRKQLAHFPELAWIVSGDDQRAA